MGNYILTSNGELYHYGVKGMKWVSEKTYTTLTPRTTTSEPEN